VQQRETEVVADEEQIFLIKLQAQLAKQPTVPSGPGLRESPNRSGPIGPKSSPRPAASAGGSTVITPKKPDATKLNAATSDTGVLANFFNSLLSKKTTPSSTTVTSPDSRTADQLSPANETSPADSTLSPSSSSVNEADSLA
jgi:dynein light intermediate chain 1